MAIERITRPLLDVLEQLYQAHLRDEELHGWFIVHATKRVGPTVYRVLDRLEDAGWVTTRWERHNPDPSRPRRRFYRLSATGVPRTRELLAERRPQAIISAAVRPSFGTGPSAWLIGLAGGAR